MAPKYCNSAFKKYCLNLEQNKYKDKYITPPADVPWCPILSLNKKPSHSANKIFSLIFACQLPNLC